MTTAIFLYVLHNGVKPVCGRFWIRSWSKICRNLKATLLSFLDSLGIVLCVSNLPLSIKYRRNIQNHSTDEQKDYYWRLRKQWTESLTNFYWVAGKLWQNSHGSQIKCNSKEPDFNCRRMRRYYFSKIFNKGYIDRSISRNFPDEFWTR